MFTYEQIEVFEGLRFDYDETLIQLAIPILLNSADEGIVSHIFGEEEEDMLSKSEFINRLVKDQCSWILQPSAIRARLSLILDEDE